MLNRSMRTTYSGKTQNNDARKERKGQNSSLWTKRDEEDCLVLNKRLQKKKNLKIKMGTEYPTFEDVFVNETVQAITQLRMKNRLKEVKEPELSDGTGEK